MSLQHYVITVYQHTNAGNPSDPNIGYWLRWQPADNVNGTITAKPNSVASPVPNNQMAALVPGSSNPFPTLAAAQAVITAAQAYYAAQNAQVADVSVDTLVYGPITL